jgi:hypothetical protein
MLSGGSALYVAKTSGAQQQAHWKIGSPLRPCRVRVLAGAVAHVPQKGGARASGMRAAFVTRRDRPFGPTPHPPDLELPDFGSLADALLGES